MIFLSDWTIRHNGIEHKIELLQGDLTRLPVEHAVDVLVVSAFSGDYSSTSGSLIGALDRAGLSVADLARNKQHDLRQQFSCWLSKPIRTAFHFGQVLCIESGHRGEPPEIIDDLFKALAPFLLTDYPNSSVAMPLIGAGDQCCSETEMLEAILASAANWIEQGLPLKLLKIVVYDAESAQGLRDVFESFKSRHHVKERRSKTHSSTEVRNYDVFLSYSHQDCMTADFVEQQLTDGGLRVFRDRSVLRIGATWLMEVAEALDASRSVLALYSTHYWTSENCKMEYLAALMRHNDSGKPLLFPIYVSDANILYLFRNIQYIDCRTEDKAKLAAACSRLARDLV